MSKPNYTIGVPKATYEKYKALSSLTGKTLKELFDEASSEYIKPYEKILKKYETMVSELSGIASKKTGKRDRNSSKAEALEGTIIEKSKIKNKINDDFIDNSKVEKFNSNINEVVVDNIDKEPLIVEEFNSNIDKKANEVVVHKTEKDNIDKVEEPVIKEIKNQDPLVKETVDETKNQEPIVKATIEKTKIEEPLVKENKNENENNFSIGGGSSGESINNLFK